MRRDRRLLGRASSLYDDRRSMRNDALSIGGIIAVIGLCAAMLLSG